ncbi:hypothetical protein CBR_g4340 [Chara braunii]|uniref:Reverse transcriptase/retrotransposon-derived protein RNase H-like domain-containing protein n=1 Tax=Chara braunii TaxID=69332 RepID=A0A388JRQ1_CHABU|nr:hypothetical protein CBR_g4340 [Chara braunii]|eukprot:GBG60382.1 hypothetical protein CBR_g4340 [Chara braunii]
MTKLRSFLGLANYYRKFVRNFSTIAASLRRLLKKDAIWKWDKDCTSALKKLKRALIKYPVLKVADPSLPFVVTTDASQYGIGAVLRQDDGNGYKPVEFMSARMPSEKVATSTYERELYALRQALEHWKHYLLGRHFKVYSDHGTLRWLKTQAKMTPELTRWAAEIDQYDFELKPVKGKYNVVANALSRRSDYFGAIAHYMDMRTNLQEEVRQTFLVRKGAAGLTATKMENKIGLRMVQNGDIQLQAVFVPEEDRLTGVSSFQDTNKVLAGSRVMVAWQPVGIVMGVFDMCNRYLKERRQFGVPLAAMQLNQEKLVRMLGNVQAMILVAWRVSKLYEEGKMTPGHASLAKAWNTQRARETVALGRELLGGNGILVDYLVAKAFSDIEPIYSYEGTYDINALVVGREVTGVASMKPRLPTSSREHF